MSNLDNITQGLEDLTQEEQAELVKRLETVLGQTKTRFMEDKRQSALKSQYDLDMQNLNLNGLSSQARVRRITALKAKYRAQGLEVW